MMSKRLKPWLFRLFQAINRKTTCLNSLKRMLGLQWLATRLLSVSGKKMASVLKNLRTNYIELKSIKNKNKKKYHYKTSSKLEDNLILLA